jgi:hypothetical protein
VTLPLFPSDKTIDERFAEFHAANPQVFELFAKFARELREAGLEKGSAELIVQRIRWHAAVVTRGDSFKINDHYRARYARPLVETCPEFAGWFEFRKSITVSAGPGPQGPTRKGRAA